MLWSPGELPGDSPRIEHHMGSGSKSSEEKGRKGKRSELSDPLLSHRDRLHKALSLGIRFDEKGEKKWQCNDAMIAMHAISAMSKFVENITPELLDNSLVKDSVTIIFVALEGILQYENGAVLRPATHCAAKLFACLGRSLCKYYLLGVIPCLLQLLSSHHVDIAKSSAMSLKCILTNSTNLKLKNKEIWNILTEGKATDKIINSLQQYEIGMHSGGYVIEFSSLLREILWILPESRYPVWRNSKLMDELGALCQTPDHAVSTAIVRLFSVLALCDGVAYDILQSKASFISNLTLLLQSSVPISLRTEMLILFQHLMKSEKGCLLLTNMCCKSIVQGIVNAMGGWKSTSGEKIPVYQMHLIVEGCRTAQITRWPGRHHSYFWKLGIDSLLLDLLKKTAGQGITSCLDLRITSHNNVRELRSLVWDIIGGLSMNYEGECDAVITPSKRVSLEKLILYTCSLSVDGMLRKNPSFHDSYRFPGQLELEPMLRASLLMIFSPSKYISSSARDTISDQLKDKDGSEYLEQLLEFLRLYANDEYVIAPENAQVTLSLMALACYSSLSEYQSLILEKGGLRILSNIVGKCSSSSCHFSRSVLAPHLVSYPVPRACCSNYMEEEVEHVMLLYSLQALGEILSGFVSDRHPLFSKDMSVAVNFDTQYLTKDLMLIFDKNFCRDVKWYAAYCLAFFGLYGFPSRMGRKMKKALEEAEFKDLNLKIYGHKSLLVHHVILLARCPSLLSQEISASMNEMGGIFLNQNSTACKMNMEKEIQFSRFVEKDVLEKLLEYIYIGFCQADAGLVKKLRVLSKHCHLNALLAMLQMEYPRCGSPIPRFDLTSALGPPGHLISDIILEAKEAVEGWGCIVCHLSTPHAHAHKVVLCSNSTYMQAMLLSGMQESSSPKLKVPVSWKALTKLLHWFYTGELPKLDFTCQWITMEKSAQSDELSPYIELCWLAEYWCLDELEDENTKLLLACLRLTSSFPIQAIQIAANLGREKIVKAAVSCIAQYFSQLLESNELEGIEEGIIEDLRLEFFKQRHASGS